MKAKSIILLVGTLLIGFVLGMLTSAQIRFQKLKPVKVYFSEEKFREGFYRAIQPDEKQKVAIEHVLDKYAELNSTLQQNFRRNLDANMKAFRRELDTRLTKEQIARLREMDERRQEMIRQHRKNREKDTLNRRFNRYNDEKSFRDGHAPIHGSDSTVIPK
jgi:hypothetical protein